MCKFNIFWIFALVCLLPFPVIANEKPDAFELLDKFAVTQEKFRSFIAKVEYSQISGDNSSSKKRVMKSTAEIRVGGKKANIRQHVWGDISPERYIPEDKEYYASRLWDGKDYYSYSKAKVVDEFSKGTVFVVKDAKTDLIQDAKNEQHSQHISILRSFPDSGTKGYLAQDIERVDKIIRKGSSVFVRDRMEKIGDSDCYVIEAKTKRGNYKLWLDPSHGYNIARAEMKRGEGDETGYGVVRRKLKQDTSIATCVRNVRFEKIGDLWIAVEADLDLNMVYSKKSHYAHTGHYKITEIVFNPDHDALGSFVQDDIINRAKVVLTDGKNNVTVPIRYTWQDGELIANVDKLIMKQIDEEVESLLKEKVKSKSDPKAITSEPKPKSLIQPAVLTVSELQDKYRAAQNNQLISFIAKGESTIEYVGVSGSSSRAEKTSSQFCYDGDRFSHRAYIWGDAVPREEACYKSFLWDGQSSYVYSKGNESYMNKVYIRKYIAGKQRAISTEYKGAPLMGICSGDYDQIDSILSKARSISVSDKKDMIAGSECYVIEADTDRGNYKVWIDPKHGYNIAQVEIQREKGDLFNHKERVKKSMSFSLKNVRFEKISGVWIPMEADMQLVQDGQGEVIKWHHKRVEMVLNPDFKALGSFVPDDIPNGTPVSSRDFRGSYIWENGKPVVKR